MSSDKASKERDTFARAFALGAISIFDLMGLIIYVMMRRRLPVVEPQRSSVEPFRFATSTIDDAHREVLGA